jgi:hypothetical protein
MIENWMKKHLVSDSNYNIVKATIPNSLHKEMKFKITFAFTVGDTT